jgi:Bacterial SH3 domain
MPKLFQVFFLLFIATQSHAIDYYKPGDTLWVWAKNGLNIRSEPNASSSVLGKIENGNKVIMLDYPEKGVSFSIEEIKKTVVEDPETGKKRQIHFNLDGYWAKIQYGSQVGFVFDAFLSKLPTFLGHSYENNSQNGYYVDCLNKHNKLINKIGDKVRDEFDRFDVRYIFDNGCIVSMSGGNGWGTMEMLFTGNLSLIEGYLIYANTMKFKDDKLMDIGEDSLLFEVEMGTVSIKKVGSFIIIYTQHSC